MMLGKSTRGQRVRLNCYVFDTDRFLTDPDSPQSACDMDQLFLLPGKAFILFPFKKTTKNMPTFDRTFEIHSFEQNFFME